MVEAQAQGRGTGRQEQRTACRTYGWLLPVHQMQAVWEGLLLRYMGSVSE